ncbi:MAG: response regulator transcription factor [Candidatus Gracilibacteria bacterium]|nr:response regulator transcription factor [Candidatus Gracilibacteria bacterium]
MLISIIEDENLLATNIAKKLEKNSHSVNIFNNISDFKNSKNIIFDLYIIDISLPDGNGFNVIKWLREAKKITNPIIITSGYNDTDKKVYGLNIGADDYIAKPFSPEELIARINAVVRRTKKTPVNTIIKHNDIKYDLKEKMLTKGKNIIDLNKKEIEILELFLENKGKLISKTKVINYIWGDYESRYVTDNTINVTISRLRKKLGTSFNLVTLVGKGYKLEK